MTKREFKPFEKVLVRDDAAHDGWRASFFSHYENGRPVTVNGWSFSRMIPYEGNEKLLGTRDEPEPELKKGDVVLVWDEGDDYKEVRVYSHHDGDFRKHMAYTCLLGDGQTTGARGWDYAVKFTPASVETPAS